MGTTRQRQRLLINGLVTVFLLSLLGGCEPRNAQNTNGTTPELSPELSPETTPEQILAEDIKGLKAELAAIEKLIFDPTPMYGNAQKQLTKFQQSFQAFSGTYQNNPKFKPQIDKISDLLKDVEIYLDDSDLQTFKPEFNAKLRPIFDDLTSGLDSFTKLSNTPPSGTTTPETQAQQGSTTATNTSTTQSQSPGDHKYDGTQVFFTLGFLVIIFVILLLVKPKIKELKKIFNQSKDNSPKSNDESADKINPQAKTQHSENQSQQHRGHNRSKQLAHKIDALTEKFTSLASGINNLSKHLPTTYDIEEFQKTLNRIEEKIKNISISGTVGGTYSDNNNVEPISSLHQENQILNQRNENLRNEIDLLQKENRNLQQKETNKSDEIEKLKKQLEDQSSNSHTKAVNSVQDEQLKQTFTNLTEENERLKKICSDLEQNIKTNNTAHQDELEERDRQLTVIQQKLEEANIKINKVTAERDELKTEINQLKPTQKNNGNSFGRTKKQEILKLSVEKQQKSSTSSILPTDIKLLVELHKNKLEKLQSSTYIIVGFSSDTFEQLRAEKDCSVILDEKPGMYLVVSSSQKSSDSWLFPKNNQINSVEYDSSLKYLFECPEYQEGLTTFTLIKPAKVSKFGSNQWQLIEKGELEFTS